MDCEKLSADALNIFEQIKVYYPPNPWNKPRWTKNGKVNDNVWRDLRKKEDRAKLIAWYENLIGRAIVSRAGTLRNRREKLTRSVFNFKLCKKWIELATLLHELDFQIETLDKFLLVVED